MFKDSRYQALIDVAGEVAQFLLSTDIADLLVELIQNDLDAGSSRTRIVVHSDRLVCEGNGRPIDANGWERLSFLLAAGGAVPPKEGGIGVKNHGLRVGFHLGDRIVVQSAGRRTELDLCAGPSDTFYPGAWRAPQPDADAPRRGTRISIHFRNRPLAVPAAEGLVLRRTEAAMADALIYAFAHTALDALIGVTHPRTCPHYSVELVPHSRSGATLRFAARAIRSGRGRLIERSARRDDGHRTVTRRERAWRFALEHADGLARVPKTFIDGGRVHAEIAWAIGRHGQPTPAAGSYRYPIAYPAGVDDARTGYGFHIAGPFISDVARHGLATESPQNEAICTAARDAATRVFTEILIPVHGPAALKLLCPPDGPSSQAARQLIVGIAARGGLPVAAQPGRRGPAQPRRAAWSMAGPGGRPILVPHDGKRAPDASLGGLGPEGWPVLHPLTPSFVTALLLAACSGHVRGFTIDDVIDRMCDTSPDLAWPSAEARLAEFADAARAHLYLDALRRAPDAVRRRADDLRSKAVLPQDGGGVIAWHDAQLSDVPVPVIAGVPRDVVSLHIRRHPLLRAGPLRLRRFNLQALLANLDWREDDDRVRAQYFAWLLQNAKAFKTSTLRKLAKHPVFPAAQGTFHALNDLCVLSDKTLAKLLGGHVRRPTPAVRAFVALRPSALRMRSVPAADEVRAWYDARMALVPAAGPLSAAAAAALEDVEIGLDGVVKALRGRASWRDALPQDHRARTKAGTVRPIAELHVDARLHRDLALRAEDLASGVHLDLYRCLGIHESPTPEALLAAMRDDGRGADVFFRRLNSYLKRGGDPTALWHITCVPTASGQLAPVRTCLVGKTDFWGTWRVPVRGGSPERIGHLNQIGVVGPRLSEPASRDFFGWLAAQPTATLVDHLPIVANHWRDRTNGPLGWWQDNGETACLPVVTGGRLRLLAFDALRGTVFVPDFPGVNEQVARRDPERAVVWDGLGGTFVALQDHGVKSLRQELQPPQSVDAYGAVRRAHNELQSVIATLQTALRRRTLGRALDRAGIAHVQLVEHWTARLRRLTEIRYARSIVATYGLGRQIYTVPRDAAVDADGGVWLAGAKAASMALFEALAEHLFRPSNDGLPYKLYRALEELGRDAGLGASAVDADGLDDAAEVDGDVATASTDAHVTEQDRATGHDAPDPGPPPVPDPQPFDATAPSSADGPTPAATRPRRSPVNSRTASLRDSPDEQREKAALKANHYAYHCQACLGIGPPRTIAPPMTYVAHEQYRRAVIEAHHVEHLQNEGALGAGNLLVLCQFHHNFLGDRLTPEDIVARLRRAKPTVRRFPSDRAATATHPVRGLQIDVPLDAPPFGVPLFFTEEHARIWLARSAQRHARTRASNVATRRRD